MQRSLSKAADNYKLSRGYVATAIAHRRAMVAPMVGCKMSADPFIGDANNPAKTLAAALRERRACQYAAAMGRRAGSLPADLSAFAAIWNEATATVHFVMLGSQQHVYASFAISERVMTFDADASAPCLPAPETAPTRCADTVDAFEAPAPETAPDGEDVCAVLEMMFAMAELNGQMVTA